MEVPQYIPGTFEVVPSLEGTLFKDRFNESSIRQIHLSKVQLCRDKVACLEIELEKPYAATACAINAYGEKVVRHNSLIIHYDYISICKIVRFLVENNTFSGNGVALLTDFAESILQQSKDQLELAQEKLKRLKKKSETNTLKYANKELYKSYEIKDLEKEISEFIAYKTEQKAVSKNLLIKPLYLNNVLHEEYPPS